MLSGFKPLKICTKYKHTYIDGYRYYGAPWDKGNDLRLTSVVLLQNKCKIKSLVQEQTEATEVAEMCRMPRKRLMSTKRNSSLFLPMQIIQERGQARRPKTETSVFQSYLRSEILSLLHYAIDHILS